MDFPGNVGMVGGCRTCKSQKYQTDGVIDRPRERGTINGRKPHIYLDIVDREVKLQLPSQMVGRGKAQLAIHGDQKGKKHIVPMQRVEGRDIRSTDLFLSTSHFFRISGKHLSNI